MTNPASITHHTQSGGPADAGGHAFNTMFSLVYADLEHIAHMLMNNERPDHTLGTQGLMHEAYARLIASYRGTGTLDAMRPDELRSLAALVMRRVLVDHARNRNTRVKAQTAYQDHLEACYELVQGVVVDLIALDDALAELEMLDPDKARVVELRFFGAMSMKQIAVVLGRPLRSIERDWAFSRAWLCGRLEQGPPA